MHLLPIINAFSNKRSITDYYRPVTTMPIFKSSNSSTPAMHFRSVTSESGGPKLTERAVLSLTSVIVSDDPIQSGYKRNRSALGAVASRVHNSKSLDVFAKCAQCAFLNFSSAFDSAPQYLLRKLEQFDYPKSLLLWLSDYFANITQCTRLKTNKSTQKISNSRALHGGVLSP